MEVHMNVYKYISIYDVYIIGHDRGINDGGTNYRY
jgi:hypothetical protein